MFHRPAGVIQNGERGMSQQRSFDDVSDGPQRSSIILNWWWKGPIIWLISTDGLLYDCVIDYDSPLFFVRDATQCLFGCGWTQNQFPRKSDCTSISSSCCHCLWSAPDGCGGCRSLIVAVPVRGGRSPESSSSSWYHSSWSSSWTSSMRFPLRTVSRHRLPSAKS
jgi:hypothetical protein